jgi:hypothetical protein
MKHIIEFFGFLALAGEAATIYTLVACVSSGEPFPAWFYPAMVLLTVGGIAAVIGVLAVLAVHGIRNRQKRLGMIRIEGRTGRVYIGK